MSRTNRLSTLEAHVTPGVSLVVGDGAIARAVLGALVDLLHRVAAPTGARGSVLLMTGGLIVLGFLFLSFLFRSAIVGDLAPVANARAPLPRIRPPAAASARAPARLPPGDPFVAGRRLGREAPDALDPGIDRIREHGADARILESDERRKRIRLYACPSCDAGGDARGCEYERGLLAGVFETLSGDVVRVREAACRARGAHHCEFEVLHAPLGRRA